MPQPPALHRIDSFKPKGATTTADGSCFLHGLCGTGSENGQMVSGDWKAMRADLQRFLSLFKAPLSAVEEPWKTYITPILKSFNPASEAESFGLKGGFDPETENGYKNCVAVIEKSSRWFYGREAPLIGLFGKRDVLILEAGNTTLYRFNQEDYDQLQKKFIPNPVWLADRAKKGFKEGEIPISGIQHVNGNHWEQLRVPEVTLEQQKTYWKLRDLEGTLKLRSRPNETSDREKIKTLTNRNELEEVEKIWKDAQYAFSNFQKDSKMILAFQTGGYGDFSEIRANIDDTLARIEKRKKILGIVETYKDFKEANSTNDLRKNYAEKKCALLARLKQDNLCCDGLSYQAHSQTPLPTANLEKGKFYFEIKNDTLHYAVLAFDGKTTKSGKITVADLVKNKIDPWARENGQKKLKEDDIKLNIASINTEITDKKGDTKSDYPGQRDFKAVQQTLEQYSADDLNLLWLSILSDPRGQVDQVRWAPAMNKDSIASVMNVKKEQKRLEEAINQDKNVVDKETKLKELHALYLDPVQKEEKQDKEALSKQAPTIQTPPTATVSPAPKQVQPQKTVQPKLILLPGEISGEKGGSLEIACNTAGLELEKVIFLFPSGQQLGHHSFQPNATLTDKVLQLKQHGEGLAVPAVQWGLPSLLNPKGKPTLGLPTCFEVELSKKDKNEVITSSLQDLWAAVGAGYSFLLPVRKVTDADWVDPRTKKVKKANRMYFKEEYDFKFVDKPYQLSWFGGIQDWNKPDHEAMGNRYAMHMRVLQAFMEYRNTLGEDWQEKTTQQLFTEFYIYLKNQDKKLFDHLKHNSVSIEDLKLMETAYDAGQKTLQNKAQPVQQQQTKTPTVNSTIPQQQTAQTGQQPQKPKMPSPAPTNPTGAEQKPVSQSAPQATTITTPFSNKEAHNLLLEHGFEVIENSQTQTKYQELASSGEVTISKATNSTEEVLTVMTYDTPPVQNAGAMQSAAAVFLAARPKDSLTFTISAGPEGNETPAARHTRLVDAYRRLRDAGVTDKRIQFTGGTEAEIASIRAAAAAKQTKKIPAPPLSPYPPTPITLSVKDMAEPAKKEGMQEDSSPTVKSNKK